MFYVGKSRKVEMQCKLDKIYTTLPAGERRHSPIITKNENYIHFTTLKNKLEHEFVQLVFLVSFLNFMKFSSKLINYLNYLNSNYFINRITERPAVKNIPFPIYT